MDIVKRIAKGASAPYGWYVTSGASSTGVCQDPNGCEISMAQAGAYTTPATVDVPVPTPSVSYADAGAALALPKLAQSNALGTRCPANCYQAGVDTDGNPICVDKVTGVVVTNNAPGAAPYTMAVGPDPYQVWRANAWAERGRVGGAGIPKATDPMRAVALSAYGASEPMAQAYRDQGVASDAATALALQTLLGNSGYGAAAAASGITAANQRALNNAANREAQIAYLTGAPTLAGKTIFSGVPGTIFNNNGSLFVSNPSAQDGVEQLAITNEDAQRDPQAVALAIGAPNNLAPGLVAKNVSTRAIAAQRTADDIAKRAQQAEASMANTLIRSDTAKELQDRRRQTTLELNALRSRGQSGLAADPIKQQKVDDELKTQNLYNSAPACVALYGTYANFSANYRKFGNRLPCLGVQSATGLEGL